MAKQTNNLPIEETRRTDNNRAKALSAIRQLQRLLALATHPQFDGTIAVEISAKAGFLGRPKLTHVEFDRDSTNGTT